MLSHSRPYGIADAMQFVLGQARRRAEAAERDQVAAQVRECIARSGLSRTEFASRIGTSPSRLATYATGKVAPAATLMVRMRRVSGQAAAAG